MRTTELILLALIMLGCIFKIQHWPGAGAFMVFGGGGLALFYFPFGWRTLASPKATDQLLWLTVLGGGASCIALGGLLAFFQHWPYSAQLMQLGTLACAITLALAILIRFKHPRLDLYVDGLMVRCGVLGGLAFSVWVLFSGRPH